MGGKQKRKGSNGGPRSSKSRAELWLQKKTREAEERAETRNNQRRLDQLVQESRRRRASSASDASDTSDSETDEERSEKKKRRARRRAKRRKSGDRIIEVNLDALAPTHVAEGFHVIIQVMPKAPEAPEVEPEPEAEAAVAEEEAEGQEGADQEHLHIQGNYSDAEILEWMRIVLTKADKVYDLKRLPNIHPTLPQAVETTALAKRCADVYFAGEEGCRKLRALVDDFQLQVCSVRWPSLILTSILQIIVTRGIDVHESHLGITL
jgi:hypothetical protein